MKKIPKKLQVFFDLFGSKNENFEKNLQKNVDFNVENGGISKEKINEHAKNKRQFNRLFPLKKLKKTESSQNLTKISEEIEENRQKRQFLHRLTMFRPPKKIEISENLLETSFDKENEGKTKRITRELSFKELNCKENVNFLENLINSNNETQRDQFLNTILKKLGNSIEKNEEKSEISQFGKANGPWGEPWEHKVAVFQRNSVYGHFPSYMIRNIIIKGGDDLRQELIAMQLIRKFKQIFDEAGLKLFLRPYDIMVTSQNSGILGDF